MIRTAVIPAAGAGTRMLPASKAVPKEMFAAGDRPMIQHVVEEATAAGLTRLCVIIREGKELVREHLTGAHRFPGMRPGDLAAWDRLVSSVDIGFAEQASPRGLGDALLQARDFVAGEPFIMLLPDQLFFGQPMGAAAQMVRHGSRNPLVLSSLVKLPQAELPYFPGARPLELAGVAGPEPVPVKGFLSDGEAARRCAAETHALRGFGRTLFPPAIFEFLGPAYANRSTGEIDLVASIIALARSVPHHAILLEGDACDLGTFPGYYRYLPFVRRHCRLIGKAPNRAP